MRRTGILVAALFGLAGAYTAWAQSPAATPIQTVIEYPIPTANSQPTSIVAGPDGNLWFTEFGSSKIGRITPAGVITEYPTPTTFSGPAGIAKGPDGNLWFAEYYANSVGRITPGGSITEYPVLSEGSGPYGITAGPDGNIWFTETYSGNVGQITPGGAIAEYPCVNANCAYAYSITAGPDGRLWLAPSLATSLTAITTSGVSSYVNASGVFFPQAVATGPDGNIWVTNDQFTVLRVAPGSYSYPARFSIRNGVLGLIVPGPDGNLWFTERSTSNGAQLAIITTSGGITEIPLPVPFSYPSGIATGPDGNIWFTDQTAGIIGVLVLSSPPTSAPTISPTSLTFSGAAAGGPLSQTLTLSSTNPTPFTVLSYGSYGSDSWLSVLPSSGSTANQVLAVTANPAGLTAGTYAGRINITSGAITQTINVTLTLSAATSGVLVDATAGYGLNAYYTIGESTPMGASMVITSAAGSNAATPYTISTSVTSPSGGNWLALSVNGATISSGASETTPTNVSVSFNPSGLGAGVYSGTITVSPTVGAAQTFPVTLTATPAPPTASPAALHFTYQPGGNPPPAQTIQVKDPSGAATPFVAWVSLNPGAVLVSPSSGTTPATLSVSMPAGLQGTGTYSASVNVGPLLAPGTSVPVTFTYTPAITTVSASPASLNFSYQAGGSAPAPQSIQLSASGNVITPFTVTVSSGAKWLTVTPASGGTPTTLAASISAIGLGAGIYTANIIVNPGLAGVSAVTVPVSLTVNAGAAISVTPASLSFICPAGADPSATQSIQVSATGGAAVPFTVQSVWLTAKPSGGTTPATLTVAADQGCPNTGVLMADLAINPTAGGNPPVYYPVTITTTPPFVTSPASLAFTYQIGGTAPASQSIQVSAAGSNKTINVSQVGVNWLTVTQSSSNAPSTITVSVSPEGLVPGLYTTNVVITPYQNASLPTTVPVTLTVSAGPTVSVSPSVLNFTYQSGGSAPAPQSVAVSAVGTAAVAYTAGQSANSNWLSVTPASGSTPGKMEVSVTPGGLAAGTYAANIVISPGTSGDLQTLIPVTLLIESGSATAPAISAVLNAASYSNGAVSPGEIVSIFGTAIGPANPAFLTLDSTGKVANAIGGVQVSFGSYLAPLTFAGSSQINAVVPYEVAGSASAVVEVLFDGQKSNESVVQLTTTAPAIFTVSGGTGPGAILNQDYSPNTQANPAAPGSVVQIYMTGEGLTTPAQADGALTPVNTSGVGPLTPAPQQGVSVLIGGQPANLQFAGEAPGIVAGVLQVNAWVPATANPGANSITVQVGNNISQSGVTVWVK